MSKRKLVKDSKYSYEYKYDFIKIYINDVLHICLNYKKIIGIQSWIERDGWYCIEIYTDKKEIIYNYDTYEKWESILKILDEIFK